MRRLIINADDYGLTLGVNRAIRECHNAGTVTSATLMAGGAAFANAVAEAASLPRLGVGCHVVLVDGVPESDPHSVPSLLDAQDSSRFPHGLGTVAFRAVTGRINESEVEAEAIVQIRKLQAAGIAVDHLDSHKHTHMFPQILRPLLRAAKACGIPAIRNPFAPSLGTMLKCARQYCGSRAGLWKRFAQVQLLRSMAAGFRRQAAEAGIATTDGSFGIVATGALNLEMFRAIITSLPEGTWEFVCHPGYEDADLAQVRTRLRTSRRVELDLLTSADAHSVLLESVAEGGIKNRIELITFGDLARTAGR